MKKFSLEQLLDVVKLCETKMTTETSLEKRELLSRAYAEISDILVDEMEYRTD